MSKILIMLEAVLPSGSECGHGDIYKVTMFLNKPTQWKIATWDF